MLSPCNLTVQATSSPPLKMLPRTRMVTLNRKWYGHDGLIDLYDVMQLQDQGRGIRHLTRYVRRIGQSLQARKYSLQWELRYISATFLSHAGALLPYT